jgi:hypothetical protein
MFHVIPEFNVDIGLGCNLYELNRDLPLIQDEPDIGVACREGIHQNCLTLLRGNYLTS